MGRFDVHGNVKRPTNGTIDAVTGGNPPDADQLDDGHSGVSETHGPRIPAVAGRGRAWTPAPRPRAVKQ